MGSADQSYIVRDGPGGGDERGRDCGCNTDAGAAGDSYDGLVRDIAVHLDIEVAAREVVVVYAMHAYAIESQPERVDGGGADEVRVADRRRLRQIVQSALSGCQDVLRQAVSGRLEVSGRHITAEKRLFRVDLVIDAAEHLMLIDLSDRPISDLAAGIGRVIGRGQHLRDRQRLRTNQRLRQDVVYGRRRERFVAIAGGLAGGEISGQHLRGGYEGSLIRRVLTRDRALVTGKEEKLVLEDRAAHGASELVALQCVARRREEGAGIQVAVTQKIEGVAVEGVRSRFHDRVDGRRGMHTVLCGERAGLNLEFFQSIREREGKVRGVKRIVIQGAIQKVTDAGKQTAGDGDVLPARESRGSVDAGRDRGAGELDQVG